MNLFTKKEHALLTLSGTALIFSIWSVLSYQEIISPIFLSPPIETFRNIIDLFLKNNILNDVFISVTRVLLGFMLALALGIPIGIFCGIFEKIKAFAETNISFLRYIPVAAFIPLATLWFGISEFEKIFLIFIGVLPYIILYTSIAAANIEKEYIEVGITLGANKKQIIKKIILPRSLPNIWDMARIEMGGAWALVILAEIIASNSGLGYRLVLAQRFLHTTDIFSLIIIISLIGFILDQLLEFGFLSLFPWAEKTRPKKI
jgi:NitT/TauT family transport system permease protein